MLLKVNHLEEIYSKNRENAPMAFRDISFSANQGEFVTTMGGSGSGKSTLLNISSMLDDPTRGGVFLEDKNILSLKNAEKIDFRRRKLGYVFQNFNLLDQLTVKDNILLLLVLQGMKAQDPKTPLEEVVERLDLEKFLTKYPYQIFGGWGQRTTTARTLISNPKLILADEPTGALDSGMSEELFHYFSITNNREQTILMVTHSAKAASATNRVLFIKDGRTLYQVYRGQESWQEFMSRISQAMTLVLRGGHLD